MHKLKSGISTYLAMFAKDGKSFVYSLASHGETTIWRQPWRNGEAVGARFPPSNFPSLCGRTIWAMHIR
jgi:hypothetical protein